MFVEDQGAEVLRCSQSWRSAMLHTASRGTQRIVLSYLLFASAWIFLADRLLDALIADQLIAGRLQALKGWAFVVTTAAILYSFVRHELGVRQRAEEQLAHLLGREQAARAEAELARQRLANVFEVINDAFVALDIEWRYTYVNERAGHIFGRQPKDLIGKHIWTEFPEGIGQPFYEAYYKAVEEQIPIRLEEYYPPYDRWFENRIFPSKEGLSIFFQDITERKRAEAALRTSEQQLSLIFDTVGDVLFLLAVEPGECFRFIAMNSSGLAVTGLAREQVVGKRIEEVLPETAHALVIGNYKEAIRENKTVRWEEISEYPTGTLYGEVAVTPVSDTAGNCTHLIGSVHDITGIRRAEQALRESEERYRLVVRASNTGIWDWDLRSNDVYFSSIWKSQLGYAEHDFPNRFDEWERRLHPEDKDKILAAIQAYLANPGQDYHQEFRLRHKDGSYRWIFTQAQLLLDEDGNPCRMVGTHIDITERKRAEEALRHYAERLNVLHEIDQAILAAQSAEEIASAALERVQRLVPCQWASLTVFDYEAEEVIVLAVRVDGETLVQRGTRFSLQEVEIPYRLRQGSTHVIDDLSTLPTLPPVLEALRAARVRSFMAVPLRSQGELIGTLNLAAQDPSTFQSADIDIACEVADQLAIAIRGAQLHEAEQRARRIAAILHAANEALTRTLDLSSVLEMLLDHLGQLVPYDSANVMLLTADSRLVVHSTRGYEEWTDSANIRTISFDPSATPNLQTVLMTRKSLRIPDTTEYLGWQHDIGAKHVQSWFGVPLLANDQVIGIYSVDKSQKAFFTEEHVRLAEALAAQAAIAIQNARLHAQVQRHAAELELRVAQRTAQLEAANKELEAFSYSVSHDLRAPLRAVSGFAEIIARRHRRSLNDEGQHYVDNIVEASARMGQLIDDLLAYSRVGRQSLRRQSVSLHDLLAHVIKDLAAPVAESGASIDLPDDRQTVCGDSTLLNQIFANLLDNALTYHRPGVPPQVTISWQDEPAYVVICVSDNGIGIPAEHHTKIFNVFQRLHSEDDYPGTGIGLAIVKKSVELLGGRVWLESAVDEGSTFFIQLPKE
jgi:PAS domain S-box-containing protein